MAAPDNNDKALSQAQETRLIHHIDGQLLSLSRKLKRQTASSDDATRGISLLTKEMTQLLSLLQQVPLGSASLVVAYLISMLDATMDSLTLLPVQASDSTDIFALMHKMDDAFVRLIKANKVTVTEATRLRALFATCRALLYDKLGFNIKSIEEIDEDDVSSSSATLEAQLSSVFEQSLDLLE